MIYRIGKYYETFIYNAIGGVVNKLALPKAFLAL
jgi:hypothetical protein